MAQQQTRLESNIVLDQLMLVHRDTTISWLRRWKPKGWKGAWYPINEKKIVFLTEFVQLKKLLHFKYVRLARLKLLEFCTIEALGYYDKESGTLYINAQEIKLNTKEKIR